jgi:ribosomal protein L11 methyltransferase
MSQKWAEIEIPVGGDAQEIVGALLTDVAGCHGYASTPLVVRGYLPVDDRLENTLLTLKQALNDSPDLPGPAPEITLRFVAEEDWATAWKQFFKPQRIGRRIVVKPTWEEFTPGPDDLVLQIDPGMAFGTGLHATTRLCLRAIEDEVTPGVSVADVGTGSGILAVGAALLGASRVEAVDNDPLAVRVAHENIAVNGVGDRISVYEAATPPPGTFDIVVANILADVILGMADALHAAVKPGGLLIASGIIESRAEDVRRGLTAAGFTAVETREEGEWVAVVARR